MSVLLGERRSVLFSGDHLWWRPEQAVLVASERYCWWDFQEQLRSVERLKELDVAWLLPSAMATPTRLPPGSGGLP